MNNLISVIIPVKNGANYINQAIEGILKQGMNVEIIVVDDCSTDNTVEIADSYSCKIVKHETSKGQVAGKNSGLKIANGEYIMFHDHDDVMCENALKKLYDAIEKDPEICAVMAKVQDFISNDCANKNTPIKKEPYFGLFTGAVLIRKTVFDKVGLFDENINTGEIISLMSKMDAENLKTEKIDFVSTMRRVHDTNCGKTNRNKEFKDYAAVLRMRMKNHL